MTKDEIYMALGELAMTKRDTLLRKDRALSALQKEFRLELKAFRVEAKDGNVVSEKADKAAFDSRAENGFVRNAINRHAKINVGKAYDGAIAEIGVQMSKLEEQLKELEQ